MPAHVGFLGTGIMGTPMAQNLLKAGYVSIIYTSLQASIWNLDSKA